MELMINWLHSIEKKASNFYLDAAVFFKDDQELSGLLKQLSQEEASHASMLMAAYGDSATTADLSVPPIILDETEKGRVESVFAEAAGMLQEGKLTRESVVGFMARIELTEWNDFYLFIINSLMKDARRSGEIALAVSQHKKSVEKYIAALPEGKVLIDRMNSLLSDRKRKVLVVEDNEAVRRLLYAVLENSYLVETAQNGSEALNKVSGQYFDAIISDVEMPLMTGREFFKEAFLKEPGVRERIVFFTAAPDRHIDFFREFDLQYLAKPVSIATIQKTVSDIINRAATK